LRILGRLGTPALGVVATSALFAAVHVLGSATWERLASIFLLGVLLALLRIRSGSLWPTIACHWGFQVFSYAAVLGVLPARLVLRGSVLLVGRADQLDAGLVSIVALAAATVCAALVTRAGRQPGHR
jgi:membrane protease YdiL (CAAX protease family)